MAPADQRYRAETSLYLKPRFGPPNLTAVLRVLEIIEGAGSKSDSTPFRLEYVAFSCVRSVFTETATEANLQAKTFVTLNLISLKKGVRGDKIGHKESGYPLLCPKAALL